MSWDSFYSSFKRAVGTAAEKINQTTDLATLQIKLGVAEHKLESAYAQLGRDAYRQFTTEEDTVDAVSKSMKLVEEAQKVVDDLAAQIDKCKSGSAGNGADAEGSAKSDAKSADAAEDADGECSDKADTDKADTDET